MEQGHRPVPEVERGPGGEGVVGRDDGRGQHLLGMGVVVGLGVVGLGPLAGGARPLGGDLVGMDGHVTERGPHGCVAEREVEVFVGVDDRRTSAGERTAMSR